MHSGQLTIPTALSPRQGPSEGGTIFAVKAHPDNTGVLWVGNNSDTIHPYDGYPLAAGEKVIIKLRNLSELWFDVDVSGEKMCWIKLV